MSNTYTCQFPSCDKVFSKAFELKKHNATHEDPSRVFYCPECDFITLQKKNLGIHLATHTGEKIHQCPDMVSSDGSFEFPTSEERCGYRTNDPAALTKHRKRVHGYIPLLSRSRPKKGAVATSSQPRQKQDRKARAQHPQRSLPVSHHKPSPVPEGLDLAGSGAEYPFTFTVLPNAFALSLWQGNVDACGQTTDPCPSIISGYNSFMPTSATFGVPEEMDLNALYGPSPQPGWIAKYEMSYSMLGTTDMKCSPQPLPVVPPPDLAGFNVLTGQQGCLCPEWMVEAGLQGLDQSALNAHRQFYF